MCKDNRQVPWQFCEASDHTVWTLLLCMYIDSLCINPLLNMRFLACALKAIHVVANQVPRVKAVVTPLIQVTI